jgi:hypothetical protein
MQINENWKIEADESQIFLYQRKITQSKDTNEAPRTSWKRTYYGNVQQALKSLVTVELNATGLKSIEIIVKKQDEIFKLIENIKVITLDKKVYKPCKEDVEQDG